MFENIGTFFKKIMKTEPKQLTSKDAAKERLHLVLMQDRANVSVDFLELMKQEIIDVIKKYIEIDEKSIDVRLTNQSNEDGTTGAPSLYANIPIVNIKNDVKSEKIEENIEDVVDNPQEQKQVIQVQEQTDEEKEELDMKVEEKDSVEHEKFEKEENVEQEENVETTENIKENDEEIDDVPTFDELLKQSEEETSQTDDIKKENSQTENKTVNNNYNKNHKKNKNKTKN